MISRILIWGIVAAICIVATLGVMSYVRAVDDSATKVQAFDRFNSKVR
jgi:hypothetical protein